MKAAGFVTAGGRSSRMQRDKALLKLGGLTMIERVIGALQPVASSIAIIANDPVYEKFDLPVFADTNKGIGPLEAIRTALANSRQEKAVVAGCDMPFVTSELFAYLLDQAQGYDAVVPLDAEGRIEPLCAVYSTAAMSEVCRLIERGDLKMAHLFDAIHARVIEFSELRNLPRSELFFENINTPEDYARAINLIAGE
jgi:molybdopterin-guanine dinucleotide biosynthesis protein A